MKIKKLSTLTKLSFKEISETLDVPEELLRGFEKDIPYDYLFQVKRMCTILNIKLNDILEPIKLERDIKGVKMAPKVADINNYIRLINFDHFVICNKIIYYDSIYYSISPAHEELSRLKLPNLLDLFKTKKSLDEYNFAYQKKAKKE